MTATLLPAIPPTFGTIANLRDVFNKYPIDRIVASYDGKRITFTLLTPSGAVFEDHDYGCKDYSPSITRLIADYIGHFAGGFSYIKGFTGTIELDEYRELSWTGSETYHG